MQVHFSTSKLPEISVHRRFFRLLGSNLGIYKEKKNWLLLLTSNNQRLVKCVRFQRGLIVAKDIGSFFIYVDTRLTRGWHVDTWGERAMPIDYRGSGYMRSRLSVPHSQSIHPPKMASKPWNRMTSRRYTRDLLVKHTGLISKNDMISMRSPSSNAIIITISYHISYYIIDYYSLLLP